jgi:Protein of unknown function (DUF 659)
VNTTYEEMKKQRDENLSASVSGMCLTSDAWTNVSNDPIVNQMAVSSETSLLLDSVCTGEQGHTADWIAQDLKRIMGSLIHVSGTITDNTKANQKAWKILERDLLSKFFHGCVSHELHLIVKDIYAATKTKKGGSNVAKYPEGYPFEDILQFAEDCKEVLKFFHNHHAIKAKLNHLQQQSNLKALVSPAPTCWGFLEGCFQSILENEPHLYMIVSAQDFASSNAKQKEKHRATRMLSLPATLLISSRKHCSC